MAFIQLFLCLLFSSNLLAHAATTSTAVTDPDEEIPMRDNQPDSHNCTCYTVVNRSPKSPSPAQTYFSYHRFYDFRTFPASVDINGSPPHLSKSSKFGSKDPSPDDAVFNSTSWKRDWSIQYWGKKASEDAPVAVQNSMNNVFIGRDSTTNYTAADGFRGWTPPKPTAPGEGRKGITQADNYLALRTIRNPDHQSAAEIESLQKNIKFASMRFRARVRGDKGAVAGLFTYFDENNESDIEILTSDPTDTYRFTNQPATRKGEDIPGASQKISGLPPWDDWRVYRLDWLPGMSRWYIDDAFVTESKYSVPRKPSQLTLNMWGNGGEWSGQMPVGGIAQMDIMWVQIAFNTSGSRDGPPRRKHGERDLNALAAHGTTPGGIGLHTNSLQPRRQKGCSTVCTIDDLAPSDPQIRTGFPRFLYTNGPAEGSAATSLRPFISAVLALAIPLALLLA